MGDTALIAFTLGRFLGLVEMLDWGLDQELILQQMRAVRTEYLTAKEKTEEVSSAKGN